MASTSDIFAYKMERCRICLKYETNHLPLSEKLSIDGNKLSIIELLNISTDNKIYKNEQKPQTVCTVCVNEARNAYKFKLLYRQSDSILNEEFAVSLDNNDKSPNVKQEIKMENGTKENESVEMNEAIETVFSDVSIKMEESEISIENVKPEENIIPDNKEHKQRFICRCGLGFGDPNSLRYHEAIHLNEETNKCNQCGLSFYTLASLDIHKKRHAPVSYKCDLCRKIFHTNEDKVQHMKVHVECACEECGQQFTRTAHLMTHIRIRHTKYQFPCKLCNHGFWDKHALEQHEKSHQRKIKKQIESKMIEKMKRKEKNKERRIRKQERLNMKIKEEKLLKVKEEKLLKIKEEKLLNIKKEEVKQENV